MTSIKIRKFSGACPILEELDLLSLGTMRTGSSYVEILQEKLRLHMQINQCKICTHGGTMTTVKGSQFFKEEHNNKTELTRKELNLNPFENLWETVTINAAEKRSSLSVSKVAYCRFDVIKTLPLKLEPTTLFPS